MKVYRIKDDGLIATSQAIQKKRKQSGPLKYNPNTGFADYINGIKTGSGNASPSDVLSPKTFTGDDGIEKVGTIPTYSGSNIIVPSRGGTTLQTQGSYVTTNLNIMGDLDLKPENIKKGINIFDVDGTLEPKLPEYVGSNVVYPSASGTILPTNNTTLTSDINVRGDKNFIAENIKKDVTIWNVKGTFDPMPKPYKPLEYIENRESYIDTGFKPNALTTKVIYECEILEKTGGNKTLFGTRNRADARDACYFRNFNNILYLDWNGKGTRFDYEINTRYNFECLGDNVRINGIDHIGATKLDTYLPYTLGIGRANVGGSFTTWSTTSQRIYKVQIFDNGKLVRDYIPCEYDRELGMWDKVEDKFYPLTPRVEKSYEELEFLETDGSNYIDTLFKPNAKTTKLIYRTKFIEVPNVVISVLGARNGQVANSNCSVLMNRGELRLDWVGNKGTYSPHLNANQIYEIELQDNIAKVDGTQYGGKDVKEDIYINDSIVLGRIKDNGAITYDGVKQGIYSCKIYDNGSLVRDMIPCIFKETQERGMWDKAHSIFYPLIPRAVKPLGDAQPTDVLQGKTFSNDSGLQTGTMENYTGSNVVYPSASGSVLVTNGKHMTSDISVRGDANFKAENIKQGVKIWNVTGTAPSGVEIKKMRFEKTEDNIVTFPKPIMPIGVFPVTPRPYPEQFTYYVLNYIAVYAIDSNGQYNQILCFQSSKPNTVFCEYDENTKQYHICEIIGPSQGKLTNLTRTFKYVPLTKKFRIDGPGFAEAFDFYYYELD